MLGWNAANLLPWYLKLLIFRQLQSRTESCKYILNVVYSENYELDSVVACTSTTVLIKSTCKAIPCTVENSVHAIRSPSLLQPNLNLVVLARGLKYQSSLQIFLRDCFCTNWSRVQYTGKLWHYVLKRYILHTSMNYRWEISPASYIRVFLCT